MDVYGMSSAGQDVFGVDDLFDFSGDGDELFTSSTATNLFSSSTVSGSQLQYNFGDNNATNNGHHHSTDFTDHLCVPSDDVAEHEWLSNFVNDSTTNFPTNNIAGTINFRPETSSIHSRSRTKRTRAPSTTTTTWTSPPSPTTHIFETSPETTTDSGVVRRCTHCASEKTPQWRTGPLGPKTLCNACGVRYKSGRLVPEYRPAASPTFVLTQHSNSHRKVMELRRQKEMILGHQSHHHHHHPQQQQVFSPEQKTYSGRHHHQIC